MITPRYQGPQVDPHVAWTKVKSSAMRRPYLDCGCRNSPGTDTYLHLGCARIACKRHADDAHECQHYEPEVPPRECWQCPRCPYSTDIDGLRRLHEVNHRAVNSCTGPGCYWYEQEEIGRSVRRVLDEALPKLEALVDQQLSREVNGG